MFYEAILAFFWHKWQISQFTKVHLENGWNSKRMITEVKAAIPLETTRRAFSNQEKSKQRSAIGSIYFISVGQKYPKVL